MKIYLNMPVGNFYGWAICGKNLLKCLSEKLEVGYIESPLENQMRYLSEQHLVDKFRVPDNITSGTIIHTLTPEMEPHCKSWGDKNIGYMFYEKETLSEKQIANLKRFDVVVAGSTWNAEVIRKHGIECHSIPQGVDQSIFSYQRSRNDEFFVIYSGGKREPRKSQYIVVEVFDKFFKKHPDSRLIANWTNVFTHENINIPAGAVNPNLLTQKDLVKYMGSSSIGVFPNEFEGGTNLVLMEYLSTGRTAIVNDSTGQKDVVKEDYAYLINGTKEDLVRGLLDYLEHAYSNRDELKVMGRKAHEAMKEFTWERMADRFIEFL